MTNHRKTNPESAAKAGLAYYKKLETVIPQIPRGMTSYLLTMRLSKPCTVSRKRRLLKLCGGMLG